jgi:hypothetical protein
MVGVEFCNYVEIPGLVSRLVSIARQNNLNSERLGSKRNFRQLIPYCRFGHILTFLLILSCLALQKNESIIASWARSRRQICFRQVIPYSLVSEIMIKNYLITVIGVDSCLGLQKDESIIASWARSRRQICFRQVIPYSLLSEIMIKNYLSTGISVDTGPTEVGIFESYVNQVHHNFGGIFFPCFILALEMGGEYTVRSIFPQSWGIDYGAEWY